MMYKLICLLGIIMKLRPVITKDINIIICEGYNHELRCPNKQIEIVSATFGRSNGVTCSQSSASNDKSCSTVDVASKLTKLCQGKEKCAIKSDKTVLGDPCPKISKYLSVVYKCSVPSGKYITLCEGYHKNIRCPAGQVLKFQSAFYGRSNAVTCSDERSKFTACLVPGVFEIISHWCNGDNECTLGASNSTFGDTCPSTSKYLALQYTCEVLIDRCASSPCKNQGTCKNGVSSFTCACKPGYIGNLCQTDKNECASSPCLNGGTCDDHINSYSCRCTLEYTGANCQKVIPGIAHPNIQPNVNAFVDGSQSENKITICQGASRIFSCPSNLHIHVIKAVYGRTNILSCPMSPRKPIACETDIRVPMQKICNDQISCNGLIFQQSLTETANNACLGVIPYVTLTYVCK